MAIGAVPGARTHAQSNHVTGAGGCSRVLMIDNHAGGIDLVAIACAEAGQRIHSERALDGLDGRAALARIRDGLAPPCDLVILDLNMPRMGG
jgi:CheY-like chemotaxis protein